MTLYELAALYIRGRLFFVCTFVNYQTYRGGGGENSKAFFTKRLNILIDKILQIV